MIGRHRLLFECEIFSYMEFLHGSKRLELDLKHSFLSNTKRLLVLFSNLPSTVMPRLRVGILSSAHGFRSRMDMAHEETDKQGGKSDRSWCSRVVSSTQ